jgi:hypothetical protein
MFAFLLALAIFVALFYKPRAVRRAAAARASFGGARRTPRRGVDEIALAFAAALVCTLIL